jgi:hypothetical protein
MDFDFKSIWLSIWSELEGFTFHIYDIFLYKCLW